MNLSDLDKISKRIKAINNRLIKLEKRKNPPLAIGELKAEKAELFTQIYSGDCPVKRVCLCAGDCKLLLAACGEVGTT
jgi:hypothetical protein